jgi:protein-S-isoprenylcysteine O-methyltransferase Ste14
MGAVLPPAVSVACDVLVAFAFGLVFLVFRANTFTSATVQVMPGQTVSRTGPYAWVRHPMYSAGLLLLAGTPPALGSTWGWIAVVPLGALLVLRLVDEERLLRRELPGYSEYCNQVRYRLVAGLW